MIYVLFFLIFSLLFLVFFFFKKKTAYEMRISDWSSDVCSSDLMSSVMFMSVTRVLSVVVSVLSPQADTARAAPATNVPITSLERIARICSSLIGGFGRPWRPLIPKPAWTLVGYGAPLKSDRKSTRLNSSH